MSTVAAVQEGLRALFQAQGFRCDALHVRAVCLENRARALSMDRRWVQAAFTLVAPPSGDGQCGASNGVGGVIRPSACSGGCAAEGHAADGSGAGAACENCCAASAHSAAVGEAAGRGNAGGGEAAAASSSAAASAATSGARTSHAERGLGRARRGDGAAEAAADLSSGMGSAANGDAAGRSDPSAASKEHSTAGALSAEWDPGGAEGEVCTGEAADGHSLAALFDGGAPEEVEELVRPRLAATRPCLPIYARVPKCSLSSPLSVCSPSVHTSGRLSSFGWSRGPASIVMVKVHG